MFRFEIQIYVFCKSLSYLLIIKNNKFIAIYIEISLKKRLFRSGNI
jgi:hypothetical protein